MMCVHNKFVSVFPMFIHPVNSACL